MIERKEYMALLEKWRQESDKGGYWHQAMWQIFFVEDVSGEASG